MTPVGGGVEELLLVLLVAGHLVGDFALQSERMATEKRHGQGLVPHIALIALAHMLLLAPLMSWALAAVVMGLALAHGVIDRIKSRARGRSPAPCALSWLTRGSISRRSISPGFSS